jgi:hypothetical protein
MDPWVLAGLALGVDSEAKAKEVARAIQKDARRRAHIEAVLTGLVKVGEQPSVGLLAALDAGIKAGCQATLAAMRDREEVASDG